MEAINGTIICAKDGPVSDIKFLEFYALEAMWVKFYTIFCLGAFWFF